MLNRFQRTELLLGKDKLKILKNSRVAVFGLGGVGGYAFEALVRSGVGTIDIIDKDIVSPTNLNRQIIALTSTVGRLKTDVAQERAEDINPDIKINKYNCFFMPDTASLFDFSAYDYVIDAVDTVTAKIELAVRCNEVGTPLISSMGAGNRFDITALKVADIYSTETCHLARVMRRELRRRNIKKLKTVYSSEPAAEIDQALAQECAESEESAKPMPASMVFVPAAAGLLAANEVVKDLTAAVSDGGD